MSAPRSPFDELDPLAALSKPSLPPSSLSSDSLSSSVGPVSSRGDAPPPIVISSPAKSVDVNDVSDEALISTPTSSSGLSHPLQSLPASASGSSSSPSSLSNGFASGHGHLHPPNLRLQGLSHVEPFYSLDGSTAPTSSSSQPSSPMLPSSQTSSPTAASFLASTYYAAASLTPPAPSEQQQQATGSPFPSSSSTSSHLSASPSIGTLAAATFAGIRSDASALSPHPQPPSTPTTSTGYQGSMMAPTPTQGGSTVANGHSNFFHPNRSSGGLPQQQQPHSLPPPMPQALPSPQQQLAAAQLSATGHPPPQQQPQQMQQMQQQQQQQQRAAAGGAAQGGRASGGGFFSRLLRRDDAAAPRPAAERPPPLPIYMQRLRRTHDWHWNNIHALAQQRKKYEEKHNLEVAQWESYALYPLASIAHQYYVKVIQHLNTLLQLEGKFMDNCCAAGTLVSLKDGSALPIERVRPGMQVLGRYAGNDGEEDGLIAMPVTAVIDSGRRQCVELLFSDGRTLTCTPEHRILTAGGHWVEAAELIVGESEVAVGVDHPPMERDDAGGRDWTSHSKQLAQHEQSQAASLATKRAQRQHRGVRLRHSSKQRQHQAADCVTSPSSTAHRRSWHPVMSGDSTDDDVSPVSPPSDALLTVNAVLTDSCAVLTKRSRALSDPDVQAVKSCWKEGLQRRDDCYWHEGGAETAAHSAHSGMRGVGVLPLSHLRLVGRRGVGVRRVYDLSVQSSQGEGSRSFLADGVLVHNCIEHITVVNAVCEGKLSESVIMREMLSAAGDGKVKAQEEVDAMFWPAEAEETKAVCKRLYDESKRLEAAYLELQSKMKRRDSEEVRRKRLQDWLMRGLQTRDSLQVDGFHHHPVDPRVQQLFNQCMADQRGDEGKCMRRFLDMQLTHRERMKPAAILHFISVMLGQILRTYTLDERTIPILRVYTERFIFPRIPDALAALITPEERENSRQLSHKLPWLRSLAPAQLGMDEENIPPDYAHDTAYVPLIVPPGAASSPNSQSQPAQPAAEEKKEEAASSTAPPAASSAAPAASDAAASNGQPAAGSAPSAASGANPGAGAELTSPHPPRSEDDAAQARKMVADSFPYADAINTLAQLNWDVVPFDMFFRVVSAVRLVHAAHKQYKRANREARARAQSRALTYDDPFTNFMTRLVDESGKSAEELERKDAEEREKRLKEQREAELKKLAEAAAAHKQQHSPQTASPSPLAAATASSAASFSPSRPDGVAAAETTAALPASSAADGEHLSVPAADGSAGPAAAGAAAPSTPVKFDHPLAPHHLAPPAPAEPLHVSSPSPVPSIPAPSPSIPEREVEETPLNADQLTPLCEWIVIHANVPSLPAKLGQVIRFVPGDWIRFGEAGYSFCQVESAVLYLEQLTPDTLGNPQRLPDEDKDDGQQAQRPAGPAAGDGADAASRSAAAAGTAAPASASALSAEQAANGPGPKYSRSMDDGLNRRGGGEDPFAGLLPPDAAPPPTDGSQQPPQQPPA